VTCVTPDAGHVRVAIAENLFAQCVQLGQIRWGQRDPGAATFCST
jgi:hypothetical protein